MEGDMVGLVVGLSVVGELVVGNLVGDLLGLMVGFPVGARVVGNEVGAHVCLFFLPLLQSFLRVVGVPVKAGWNSDKNSEAGGKSYSSSVHGSWCSITQFRGSSANPQCSGSRQQYCAVLPMMDVGTKPDGHSAVQWRKLAPGLTAHTGSGSSRDLTHQVIFQGACANAKFRRVLASSPPLTPGTATYSKPWSSYVTKWSRLNKPRRSHVSVLSRRGSRCRARHGTESMSACVTWSYLFHWRLRAPRGLSLPSA